MESNEKDNQPDLDSIVSAKQLQIMKAAIPYISIGEQKFISMYVKLTELMNTYKIFSQPESEIVGICSVPEESRNPSEMLNAVKRYCDDKEKEMIDMIFNFMSASSIYQTYKTQNAEQGNSPLHNSDLLSSLKKMLSPEQQAMFETYSTIFSTLS